MAPSLPPAKKPPVRLPLARYLGGLAVFFLLTALVKADGKLFALGPRNSSQSLDLVMAQQLCAAAGAHLASAEELRRAIRECPFTTCTSGWLADGFIGTIVCNKTDTELETMKVTDVHLEVDPLPKVRYDAFCMKVEGRPCGDPPSFPHTILHGHTGFEMGDELHYVCAPGHVMSNKDTTFTLLCHNCGEWFGQVQACVKDETELHYDYEDNFPDDRSIHIEEYGLNIKKTEEKEHESEQVPNRGNKSSDGNEDTGITTVSNEQGPKVVHANEDFTIGPIIQSNDTKQTKSVVSSTDESWLDGYPVTQGAIAAEQENSDKIDTSTGIEDYTTTNPATFIGVRKINTNNLDKPFVKTEIVPSTTHNDKINMIPVKLSPSVGPENVDKSSDSLSYAPTTPMDLASVTTVISLNLVTQETSAVFPLVDHVLLPEGGTITGTSLIQTVTTALSQNTFTDTVTEVEREALTYGLDGKYATTFIPCGEVDCSSPDKGPIIAIGITAVCLLLLATLLAVWCFKKRQQTISVYKLNGKEHTRYQIEMQKV